MYLYVQLEGGKSWQKKMNQTESNRSYEPTKIASLRRDANHISQCPSCQCTKFPLDYSHNVFTFSTTPSLSPSTPKQSKKS